MKKVLMSIIFTLAILVGLTAAFSTSVSADPIYAAGVVFAMTNANPGNAVEMYTRLTNGALSFDGSYPTGGNGFQNAGPPDPLGSQGSLLLTKDGKWLLAVNGGSNTITVFLVNPGSLKMVVQVSSGGILPVSLTISTNEVFVLNDGDSSNLGNITAFNLSYNGNLYMIPGSTRWLPVGGAQAFGQVKFNNSGNSLVVTDKGDNEIIVYPVGWGEMPAQNPTITSQTNPNTPFAVYFDNYDNLLVVSVNASAGPVFNGAVSSYKIDHDGSLDAINTDYNGQAASCWITGYNGYVFTTNPGSMSISAFSIKDGSGKVSLESATAATGIATIDEGITTDGKFLYALGPAAGIYGFKIGHDGTLTSLNGGNPFGATKFSGNGFAQGIAVQ